MNNRPIEFRVWDVNGKKFFDGTENFPGQFLIDTNGVLHTKSNHRDDEYGGRWWSCYEHEFSNVYKMGGFFTGLLDNKKKKIFEGDFISCLCLDYFNEDEGNVFKRVISLVIYECNVGCAGFTINNAGAFEDYILDNCKVIGNLFETPELLEKST